MSRNQEVTTADRAKQEAALLAPQDSTEETLQTQLDNLNEELEKLDRSLSKPELFSQISALIDRRIHANYRMYPGNYIAHDYLSGTQAFAGHYTAEEKKHFTDYIDQQLARIELPNKDIPFLREKMLLMYANPLTNYLATRTDNPK